MGREVKRVAAGFDWPIGEIWPGFLNPHYAQSIECPADCKGGYSPEYIALQDRWYGYVPFLPEDRGSVPFEPSHPVVRALAERNMQSVGRVYAFAIETEARRLSNIFNSMWCHHLNADDVAALVEENRLHDLTHLFVAGSGWQKKDPPHTPTPEEVNAWSLCGFGHDSVNSYVVIKAELERHGQSATCELCGGEGRKWPSPETKKAYENWQASEPPEGEWWQVWETVSEGSPVTPAFATREELIDYLVQGGDALDRNRERGGWTREHAESFVGAGWAPSMIATAGKLHEPRDGAL